MGDASTEGSANCEWGALVADVEMGKVVNKLQAGFTT